MLLPTILKKALFVLTTASLFLGFQGVSAQTPADHLQVKLLSAKNSIAPGNSLLVGFHFTLEKGWHIYWKNPGDSGLAPSVTWNLPPGFTAGPLEYPTPQRISPPQLMDYGYEGNVLLTALIHAPRNLKPGTQVKLSASVHWLVCKDLCIPGGKNISITLPAQNIHQTLNSEAMPFFRQAALHKPLPWPADWKTHAETSKTGFELTFQTDKPPSKAWFIPLNPGQIDNPSPQPFEVDGTSSRLALKKSDLLTQNPKILEGLLVLEDNQGADKSYSLAVPLAP